MCWILNQNKNILIIKSNIKVVKSCEKYWFCVFKDTIQWMSGFGWTSGDNRVKRPQDINKSDNNNKTI